MSTSPSVSCLLLIWTNRLSLRFAVKLFDENGTNLWESPYLWNTHRLLSLEMRYEKIHEFPMRMWFFKFHSVCVTQKGYKLCRSVEPFSSVCCVESISVVCVLVCAVFVDFSCSKSMLNAWMPMSLDNRRLAVSDGDNRPLFGVSVSSEDCDFVVSPTPEMAREIVKSLKRMM